MTTKNLTGRTELTRMIGTQRREKIVEHIQIHRLCKIKELIDIFQISKATIHRDLDFLEKQGLISKVHGGAVFIDGPQGEHGINIRIEKNIREKKIIAEKALQFIHEEASIFLDQSSSCLFFAKEISQNLHGNIALSTNSIEILLELEGHQNIDLLGTGGNLQHGWSAFGGVGACEMISRLNFDQIFVSCRGISIEKGLMTFHPFIVDVVRKACEAATEINLLVDSSKFTKVATYSILPVTIAKRIITDGGISPEVAQTYEKFGVEVVS